MAEPLKIGLIVEPPSLTVVYKMMGRLRMRKVPLRNLWLNSSTDFILEDIKTRHDILLGIPDDLIAKMIETLKAVKGGKQLTEAIANMENRPLKKEIDKKGFSSIKTLVRQDDVDLKNNEKPYSFMDKKMADEDTDFDPNDDLPLDNLEDSSDDDEFWK